MARLSFRCDEELVARVDEARGLIARETWLRAVVEAAATPHLSGYIDESRPLNEQRRYSQHVPGPNVENVRSSSQAKRNVKPMPKQGKR